MAPAALGTCGISHLQPLGGHPGLVPHQTSPVAPCETPVVSFFPALPPLLLTLCPLSESCRPLPSYLAGPMLSASPQHRLQFLVHFAPQMLWLHCWMITETSASSQVTQSPRLPCVPLLSTPCSIFPAPPLLLPPPGSVHTLPATWAVLPLFLPGSHCPFLQDPES